MSRIAFSYVYAAGLLLVGAITALLPPRQTFTLCGSEDTFEVHRRHYVVIDARTGKRRRHPR